ncbi:MAG: CvpA family protein [Clostridia bacterium]|nr:CvpA family protein [Clostridia bacterium]
MNSINIGLLALVGPEVTDKLLGHTYLELAIGALILFCIIFGLVKGFMRQLLGFISFAGSLAVGVIFFDELGNAANARWPFGVENPWVSNCIWYAIAFFALFIVTKLVTTVLMRALRGFIRLPIVSGLDRFFGMLLALFVLYACVSLLIGAESVLPDGDIKNLLCDQVYNGRFLSVLAGKANWLGSLVFGG